MSSRLGSPQIFVMNADGTTPTDLTPSTNYQLVNHPEFSSTGEFIVFAANPGGTTTGEDIYIMRSDGTGIRAVNLKIGTDTWPNFEPDPVRPPTLNP